MKKRTEQYPALHADQREGVFTPNEYDPLRRYSGPLIDGRKKRERLPTGRRCREDGEARKKRRTSAAGDARNTATDCISKARAKRTAERGSRGGTTNAKADRDTVRSWHRLSTRCSPPPVFKGSGLFNGGQPCRTCTQRLRRGQSPRPPRRAGFRRREDRPPIRDQTAAGDPQGVDARWAATLARSAVRPAQVDVAIRRTSDLRWAGWHIPAESCEPVLPDTPRREVSARRRVAPSSASAT